MGSFSDDDEEYRFFDAQDNFNLLSEECSEVDNCISSSSQYDFWVRSPGSVRERRGKFFRWMDSSLDQAGEENLDNECNSADILSEDVDRIASSSGAVLQSAIFQEEFSSSRSSVSSWSSNGMESSRELDPSVSFMCRNGNLDGENGCNLDDDEKETTLHTAGLDQRLHGDDGVDRNNVRILEKVKRRWLSKLRSFSCVINGESVEDNLRSNGSNPVQGARLRRVKVRNCGKRSKELSGLFMGQDIQAHDGSILAMKFSFDGHYLATAGEDKIVQIWQVVEDERSSEIDIPELDPSCIYFKVNHLSELAPLVADKEKNSKLRGLRKTADSSCVILPPKVFRIKEAPLHVFRGHSAEILDISWSKNNYLLSSSVDKTVRMWRVGCNQCLKVFPHNNYVTCVQFNPVSDDHFISGSIDGKVRIWGISNCQVVDWIDLKDIVTAVSYRPDGQGGVAGSMTGICRFFNVSDKHLQVEEQICINSKKKSPGKRITGFQFFPQDPSKVMVTSADSQVRILSGSSVITKYKGLRNGGNYNSASFTSNGKYMVSASEDCNVYMWNSSNLDEPSTPLSKTVRSFECFSTDASVAIPWCGLNTSNSGNQLNVRETNSTFSSCTHFSLAKGFCLESIPKGSATWAEEKLPASSIRPLSTAMRKSQYKFFRNSCQNLSSSNAWDLVIVTAGWDGRIRSFHNYGLPVTL